MDTVDVERSVQKCKVLKSLRIAESYDVVETISSGEIVSSTMQNNEVAPVRDNIIVLKHYGTCRSLSSE